MLVQMSTETVKLFVNSNTRVVRYSREFMSPNGTYSKYQLDIKQGNRTRLGIAFSDKVERDYNYIYFNTIISVL